MYQKGGWIFGGWSTSFWGEQSGVDQKFGADQNLERAKVEHFFGVESKMLQGEWNKNNHHDTISRLIKTPPI